MIFVELSLTAGGNMACSGREKLMRDRLPLGCQLLWGEKLPYNELYQT